MSRIAVAYVLRWLFIGICLVPYWWAVADQVAVGRGGPGPKHMEWFGATVLTLPWSLAGLAIDPANGNERLSWTALSVSGAVLNSLIFALMVRWITGGPRQLPDPELVYYFHRR